MFLDTPNPAELRQGDIIYGVYFPQMRCSSIPLLGQARPTDPAEANHPPLTPLSLEKHKRVWMTAQVEVELTYAMVLSQCCDLEVRVGKKVPGIPYIALSPLQDIPYSIKTDPAKLEQLQRNSDPLLDEPTFVNLFYVTARVPLPGDKIIDYNTIVAMPVSEYDYILGNKIFQMTDEQRIRLKRKMAYSYGRYTQEEEKAGLIPD